MGTYEQRRWADKKVMDAYRCAKCGAPAVHAQDGKRQRVLVSHSEDCPLGRSIRVRFPKLVKNVSNSH
jgi:hypothetical protein